MSGVNKFSAKFNPEIRKEALKNNPKLNENNLVPKDENQNGTTTTNNIDVAKLIEQVSGNQPLRQKQEWVNNNKIDSNVTQITNPLDIKYSDNAKYDNKNIDIYEFLSYMAEGKDLSEDEFVELLTSFINEVLKNSNFGHTTISAVTELIGLAQTKLKDKEFHIITLITQDLIPYLLAEDSDNVESNATFGDVKNIVNNIIDTIIAKRPPVVVPVEPDPEPDPVEVDPLEELFNKYKFNNSSFVAAYIDTVKDEFCLGNNSTTSSFYSIIKNQLLAKVAELGAENIDFEHAKQIIYDVMHSIWPLKSEVAEVIANTPNGKDLSADEIAEMVNSISSNIYSKCYTAYYQQTEKTGFTPEEKLDMINQVLLAKYPDLYTPEEILEGLFNKNKFNNSSFVAAYIDTIKDEFCLGNNSTASGIYTIIKNQLLAKVAELGAENIDFENAKQIIYDTIHSVLPLKSEVAEVITNTSNGKDLSADEIAEMVNSISSNIYSKCYTEYSKQTEKTGFTPEEKLDMINQVLLAKCPDLYTPEERLEILFNQHKFNNSSFVAAYIDTIKDEFCLKDSYSTSQLYSIIKNQLLAKVAELGAENIDFENAKQIIYDTLHSVWPLKSEVAEVITNTSNGKDLSADKIAEMVNSISNDIFSKCYIAYSNQTEKTGFTPEEKLDIINQILKANYLDLYEAQTAEEAKDLLYQAINNEWKKNYPTGEVNKENIAEFLAQVKERAIKYVQLSNPNYSTEFCEMIVMFMIQTVEHKYNKVTCPSLRDAFIENLSDLSFLDTGDNCFMGVTTEDSRYVETRITDIKLARNADGYRLGGSVHINSKNELYYNQDGSINQGIFFKFMTNYFKNTIFGDSLNESQMEAVFDRILQKFAGNNYVDGKVALNATNTAGANYVNKKYDNDGDGSWFNDFFRAMMEVASEVNVINLDEVKDEDVNLDALFGGKSSISTSEIHNNDKAYLLSNDPAVRLILGELINASDKYNITTDADYLDFMNIFVQMINKEAGVADTLDNKGNQVLTRAALEKYLEKHSIQELKDFIQGTELRNAYFESTFKINGEVEGFHQAGTGDCWLLSGVMSLVSTPEGKEIFRNAIGSYVGDDGKTYYTFTFYGGYEPDESGFWTYWAQKKTTYTFSQEELFELMATGKYSKIQKSEDGTLDWDLFLTEVAVSKLREEQIMHNPYLNFYNGSGNAGDAYLYMGSQDELISYLTGIDLGIIIGGNRSLDTTYHGISKSYRQNLHQLANDLMAQGLIDADGNIHNYAFYFSAGGHAYAITKITADRIYFVDPYDSSKVYYTTWSSFESGNITYYDSKTNKKVGTLSIAEAGYVGPLDECPALNQD